MEFVKKLKLQNSARDLYKMATSPRKGSPRGETVNTIDPNSATVCQHLPTIKKSFLDTREHHDMIEHIIGMIDTMDSSKKNMYLCLTSGDGCYVSNNAVIVDPELYDVDYIASWLKKVDVNVRVHSSIAVLSWE